MELANHWTGEDVAQSGVRVATRGDVSEVMKLLQTAVFRHMHVDWYLPGDWLGDPGFVVKPTAVARTEPTPFTKLLGTRDRLDACLAITPDPLPAAWVRLAAVQEGVETAVVLSQMWQYIVPRLRQQGVQTVAWLAVDDWPLPYLTDLGFTCTNHLETYHKIENAARPTPRAGLAIRPVADGDYDRLAAIEALAFAAIWRHSSRGLRQARQQAFSFDVAELAGELVGFQLSTPSERGVHLVRLTVHPERQGYGIGSALLAHALSGYAARGWAQVTLNTQVDNAASQQLYRKFGFRPSGQRYPIWTFPLQETA